MNGEIDLELYTISIIRLNTAFEKLEDSNLSEDVKKMFNDSYDDLNKLYHDIVNDLNQKEVNLNEYYLFFQNGKQVFPQYIETLANIENDELGDIISSLMNIFSNLNKIASAFNQDGMIK